MATFDTSNCDPNTLLAASKCFACIPKGQLREIIIYLLCEWLKKKDEPVVCEWWIIDFESFPTVPTGPYSSFDNALTAAGVPFLGESLAWGSPTAAITLDGSADYVLISFDLLNASTWIWKIGIVGNSGADFGGPLPTAQAALAAAQASPVLPAGFCVE